MFVYEGLEQYERCTELYGLNFKFGPLGFKVEVTKLIKKNASFYYRYSKFVLKHTIPEGAAFVATSKFYSDKKIVRSQPDPTLDINVSMAIEEMIGTVMGIDIDDMLVHMVTFNAMRNHVSHGLIVAGKYYISVICEIGNAVYSDEISYDDIPNLKEKIGKEFINVYKGNKLFGERRLVKTIAMPIDSN